MSKLPSFLLKKGHLMNTFTYQIIVYNSAHGIIYHSNIRKTSLFAILEDTSIRHPTAPPKIERNNVVIDLDTSWITTRPKFIMVVGFVFIVPLNVDKERIKKGSWYEVPKNKITSGMSYFHNNDTLQHAAIFWDVLSTVYGFCIGRFDSFFKLH